MQKVVALSTGVGSQAGFPGALAKVSEEEAARLGNELTCTGAERAGNADGSIPAFTGKYLGEAPADARQTFRRQAGRPVPE
ncbi:hypothetical protein SSTU70S_00329 [Stutzerimonas stutzeri]